MLKYVMAILFLALMIAAALPTEAVPNRTYKSIVFEDDFNYASDAEASVNWYIWRENNDPTKEVVWNATGSYVNITAAQPDANAGIFFKNPFSLTNYTAWEIDFIAYIGNSTTPWPADGMALVFYHNNQLGYGGQNMGARYNGSIGYLIEFDPYQNTYEPAVPHVALANAQTPAYQHMVIFYTAPGTGYVTDTWIYVKVTFNETSRGTNYIRGVLNITVWNTVDLVAKQPLGTPVFTYETVVTFYNPSDYIGFTASTGLYTEEHKLDWVRIALYAPKPVGGVLYSDPGVEFSALPLLMLTALMIGIGSVFYHKKKEE